MSDLFHRVNEIPCTVVELKQSLDGSTNTLSPFGPDVSHAGLGSGCKMTLVREGQKKKFVCNNKSGHTAFPSAWNDFALYLYGDRLVGAEPMLINGLPYLIEIGIVSLPSGDLLQCRYLSLDPTKEGDDGGWNGPPPS